MPNYYPDEFCHNPFDSTFNNAQQQYYPSQVPRLHVTTPEQPQSWNLLQRPQSVQDTRDQVPSPATSSHTTQTTPDPFLADRIAYRQSNPSRTNNHISFNQQNGPSMLSPAAYVSPPYNPSVREEPWSLVNLRNGENRRMRYSSRQSNAEFPQYPRVGSDVDSSALPSDSGYMSLGTSQSVLDHECERVTQPLSLEFISQYGNLNVESVAGSVTGSCVPSDQKSHVGSTRSRKSTGVTIKCDHGGCNEVFRCNSEFKKHKRRHEKPYRCTQPDCKRASQGFTTTNDLDRHKKSVHGFGVRNKSYKCVGRNCRNKEKIWPRLDNFKQHVERMHHDEDTADVIERSKLQSEEQSPFAGDESAMAHMGASLVLDSTDKSLPSYPAIASSSPLESPLKRDQHDSSSFDWNPDTMKEEHQRPGFPDETSFATQSARRQEQHHAQRRAPGLSSANPTQIPLPSDVSMDPSPKQPISEAPQSNMDYGLSNAPQTKAEQQRMARQRSVAMPSPTAPRDLDRIMSMLQQSNGPAKRDNESARNIQPELSTPSDSDTVVLSTRVLSEIAKFMEANQATQRETGRGRVPRQRICTHDGCGHTVTRACDMRKHMKRHERPYGCTYPKCFKRFGAKSDWKRHENSQHFQPEAFRCAFETSPGIICGLHLPRREVFKSHLETHRILPSQISEDLIKRSQIGKNCQVTFWCGLCRAIIPLKMRRNEAWDERFDHIAQHLEKEKKSIEEWVCVEQNRTKKELLEERRRDTSKVDDEKDKDDESESIEEDEDGDDLLPQPATLPPQPAPMTWTPIEQPSIPPFGQGSSRKREAPSDANPMDQQSKQKRRKTLTTTHCCCCNNVPFDSMQTSCINCGHVLCSNCGVLNDVFMMAGTMELYE